MPLFDQYGEEMKGEVAQLRNVPGHRWGGSCTAAAFLKEFVSDTPWVHMDIAPTAFPGVVSSHPAQGDSFRLRCRTLLELATTR